MQMCLVINFNKNNVERSRMNEIWIFILYDKQKKKEKKIEMQRFWKIRNNKLYTVHEDYLGIKRIQITNQMPLWS